jgi:hypothetical protein
LTPSADHLIHSFILYPKIYITYRIKTEKKENVKLFFENLDFSPKLWILKDIIDQFLMAEFQIALFNSDIRREGGGQFAATAP